MKPIGVSAYRVTRELAEPLLAEVPSMDDLQEMVEKLRSEIQELKGKDAFGRSKKTYSVAILAEFNLPE